MIIIDGACIKKENAAGINYVQKNTFDSSGKSAQEGN